MPFIDPGPGLRIMHLLPTERIAACCIRCNLFRTYAMSQFVARWQPTFPVWYLEDAMTPLCQARKEGGKCERWFVSPDDGTSDAG